MLASLSIRDIVLIDRLDLSFEDALCVLTGETGAGKSILLDALGLAIGNRADQRLIRPGAGNASVSAAFDIPAEHPAWSLLDEHGLAGGEASLVLRRVLGADGRSRAFINDQPVSVALLRALGDSLIEIEGQFEERGLLDPGTHRKLLDAYAGLGAAAARVAGLWSDWRRAAEEHERAAEELAGARQNRDFLSHAVAELDALDPRPGEHAALGEERSFLMHAEKLAEALNAAQQELAGSEGGGGAQGTIGAARRGLERAAELAGGRLDPVLEPLDRAAVEIEEALAALHGLAGDLDFEPGRLERIEERFFALGDLARKHGVEVDALAELRRELAGRLEAVEGGADRLAELERATAAARTAYLAAAESLSEGRGAAAHDLDSAIGAELPPLKLDKARFNTRIERLPEAGWGAHGLDRVAFEVSTVPGAEPGPLGRIASGGELSRILLALKVVLAGVGVRRALVFDEVDSGVGGQTAHAVGERLERLGRDRQVLVVTHSPQVAARGRHHWRVHKEATEAGGALGTRVVRLAREERREELARMISGAEITDEARAAAARLLGAA